MVSEQQIPLPLNAKHAVAGETVLLREREAILRWVRIVHALPPRKDGTQLVTVQNVEQFGRAKPRKVVIGSTAHIEWIS